MIRALVRRTLVVASLWLAACGGPAQAGPFSDWTAVVVAGDWQGSGGGPTEGFDNARRDVARALVRAGFEPANVRQFSTRPARYPDTRPQAAEIPAVAAAMREVAARAPGGCLFYMTSHGTPQGAVMGEAILPPGVLARILDESCGARPTVVVISACFSGVFVPQLARPNRMVMTAARRDRTSFGCGESQMYPFFDECFLQALPRARDFAALAEPVRACVRERETAEKMSPPSEPQLFVGGELRPVLPLYGFESAPTGL